MAEVMLNRKLVLEEPQKVSDGAGGFTEIWMSLGVLWADVRAGTGSERAAAGVLTVSTVPYRITVRGAPHGAPSRPKPDQRFREGSRIFRILAVTERDPKGTYLECFAREEVSA
ncbi:head-tail adaptor protein [Roseitranquillus sediminis]|uniref:head-tail adaptor protein n=1 Tax=Roseitranquillus sediminis TaxID=2809051 RepID=UPI001D0C1130|nr:head-tail adaptor protein [Roseitranquillus sediminis]MBM9595210.1 head-tail adaptor protein [Roseitranquillus sediminis]